MLYFNKKNNKITNNEDFIYISEEKYNSLKLENIDDIKNNDVEIIFDESSNSLKLKQATYYAKKIGFGMILDKSFTQPTGNDIKIIDKDTWYHLKELEKQGYVLYVVNETATTFDIETTKVPDNHYFDWNTKEIISYAKKDFDTLKSELLRIDYKDLLCKTGVKVSFLGKTYYVPFTNENISVIALNHTLPETSRVLYCNLLEGNTYTKTKINGITNTIEQNVVSKIQKSLAVVDEVVQDFIIDIQSITDMDTLNNYRENYLKLLVDKLEETIDRIRG